MKEYEELSPNCKIWWNEGFTITNEKYTQVSGYERHLTAFCLFVKIRVFVGI